MFKINSIRLVVFVVFAVLSFSCFAGDKTMSREAQAAVISRPKTITIRYFNVTSNNPKASTERCKRDFDTRNYAFKSNTPILRHRNGALTINRTYQEYPTKYGCIIGYGEEDLQTDYKGKIIKSHVIYHSIRMPKSHDSVGIFHDKYCRGFYTSSFYKSSVSK